MATEMTPDVSLETPIAGPVRSVGPWGEAWRRLRRNPVAVVSLGLIVVLVLMAVFAPLLAPHAYDA